MPLALSSSSVAPTRGDFRIGVNDAGNDVVIHVAMLAGENFGHRDAFVLGLMRQHGAAHHIADGVNAGHIGGEMVVDDHLAALHRHAEGLQAEAFGEGAPADGDQHDIGVEHLRRRRRPPVRR